MKELSPQMLRLLKAARHADGPSVGDRDRLQARLAPMLAASSALATTTGAAGAVTASVATATTAETGTVATMAAGATTSGMAAGTAATATATATATAGLSGTLTAAAPAVAAKLSLGHLLLWTALGAGVGTAGVAITVAPAPPPGLESPTSLVNATTSPSGRSLSGHRAPLTATRKTGPVAPALAGNSESGASAPTRVPSPVAAAPTATNDAVRSTVTPAALGIDRIVASESAERDEIRNQAVTAEDAIAPDLMPRARTTTLADETRLLRAAQTARSRGDEARALELLAEHARRFPDGLLKLERSVAEVLSLCAQGHAEASNRLRAQVLRQAPNIPAAARLGEPCGVAPE